MTDESHWRRSLEDAAIGVLAALIAAVAMELLWGAFVHRVPFTPFFLAMLLVVRWRGFWPAVLVAVAGFAVVSWRTLPPDESVSAPPGFSLAIALVTSYLIADRRRAAARLAASNALLEGERTRLAQVVEQMPLGVILAEAPSGRVLVANDTAARILRHPVVDAGNLADYAQYHAVHADGRVYGAEEYPLVRAITSGEVVTAEELAYVCGDGQTRQISVTAGPIRDVDGRIAGGVAAFTDVTEASHLRTQLAHSQRLEGVGRLAGGIAHDFNNLLTIVVGSAALARDDVASDHPIVEQLDAIQTAANRAGDLTGQLLAFSRRQILRPAILDLNTTVAGVGRMLSRLIGEDVIVTTRLASGLWPVKADPGQLEQVLVNLIINARDAMPTGGQLSLETANSELDPQYAAQHADVQPGSYVMLAVSDTGVGMTRETQARIFEPFFTTKVPGKGTGLGLSTVYGIIKQSGGHIWVYSEVGRGTAFKIYFPRAEAAPEPQDATTPALSWDARGTERILLVEDEVPLRALVRRVLDKAGYAVFDCQNADEARFLSRSMAGRLDLLLTDVVLPGINGRQLADELCTLRPGLKVLFMSGYTDNAIVHHGVLDDGVAFVQKPFTPDRLLRIVRETLDAR